MTLFHLPAVGGKRMKPTGAIATQNPHTNLVPCSLAVFEAFLLVPWHSEFLACFLRSGVLVNPHVGLYAAV